MLSLAGNLLRFMLHCRVGSDLRRSRPYHPLEQLAAIRG
jgi:hypothetical protein